MPLKDRKIKHNLSTVKLYDSGEKKKLRITTMAGCRTAGVEDPDELPKGVHNDPDGKLVESIIRTRSKIFELAFCNPWNWFFTGTLDPNKFSRDDLERYHSALTQWLRDYNKKHSLSIKYLLIPEKHQDGSSWHMHGFLMGLPEDHLHRFQIGERFGAGIAKKLLNGDAVYNWQPYADKFGFCSLERIRNKEACSNYVRKYISKELGKSVQACGAHMYYRSRGLKEAQQVGRGFLPAGLLGEPSYTGEMTTTWWVDATPELLDLLRENLSEHML